jgi:hypothetical protein
VSVFVYFKLDYISSDLDELIVSRVNWGNRRETDKDLSLVVDVDSKQIYMKQVPVI